jgi:crotonobetainyl-CoA:carnitine CoA-transferase CaiB-like acyl-CoA transferase
MKLGDIANQAAVGNGKPLDGIRVLALEQMQSLPYATQLLARLGAEVVKVEHPKGGDSGRGSLPAMTDPEGRRVGATFLRNNLDKRSICVDLKHPDGRQLVLDLAQKFDVVCENFKAGTLDRLGLGWEDISRPLPGRSTCRCRVSATGSPYDRWPAYAPIAEAMSGIYELKRQGDDPPLVAPMGGLGDIGSGFFAVIGVLAALRHRDATGRGQKVDIAMLDALVAITDIVPNFWSMGLRNGDLGPLIMHGFRAADGWFIIQVGREHHFAKLVEAIGHPEWVDDPRFAERQGWIDHLDTVLAPRHRGMGVDAHKGAGLRRPGRAGRSGRAVLLRRRGRGGDEHVAARNMLVEVPRTDDETQPVLVPGNPVKLSEVAEGPETRVPWLGEHTDAVLADELGLDQARIIELRESGAIA